MSNAQGDVVIPDELDGHPVTEIGEYAFVANYQLCSIVLPEGVTSIGNYAFNFCTSLSSVVLPEGLASIGDSAFNYCTSLSSVVLPEGLTSIGNCAFYYCTSLSSLALPESIASIGTDALKTMNQSLLVQVVPGSWAEVYALENGIPANTMPTSGDYIYWLEADGSARIVRMPGAEGDVVVPAELDGYPVRSIGKNAFASCTALSSIVLPDGVTSIGDSAFFRCTSLNSIALPDSVTSIGDSTFRGCTSLSSIRIPGSVTSIGVYAFDPIPDDTVLTVVPDSYAEAYAIDNGLPTDTMPTSGDYVYWVLADGTASIIRARCTESHVVIPAELDGHPVSAIGNCAFRYCTDIHSIMLPDSVTSIGDNAFNACYNLRSVVLPKDLQQIGTFAFHNCDSLHTLIIPESCTEIGKRAFPYWADDFSLVVIPSSYAEAYASENGISSASLLTSGSYGYRILADDTAEILLARSAEGDVVIPAELDGHAVSAIGDAAFANCTALTGAVLPDGVKAIGAFAFGGCTALGEVYIPDSVKAISKTAFQGCGDALVLRFNEGSAAVVYAIVQQIPYTHSR